ncbi:MAG: DUF420 domain-containing protein [Bernardetiaceae bacterium]|nr:DUF420 domain-containing protein [Bernardetiaceae bacterium]
MEHTEVQRNNRPMLILIGVLSVAIPIVVAILLFMPEAARHEGFDARFLPHLNAVLNTATSLALIAGFVFIKNKNIKWHRTMMMSAFVLSSIFLVSYVIYHSSGYAGVKYGDVDGDGIVSATELAALGIMRTVYLVILLTHIVLAVVVVPLVLLAIYYAWTEQIERHKKIVKWTFPVWTYVAITGVIVYLMISPFYT